MKLEFEGPFAIAGSDLPSVFNNSVTDVPGIYLWAVPYVGGGYLPIYVGETGVSIAHRTKEHVIQTLGGNYRICDPDSLAMGNARVVWNGLWRKGTRDKLPEYLTNAKRLVQMAIAELRLEVVFTARLMADRRLRQRLEGALAAYIQSQPLPASSVFPRDIRYRTRRIEEPAVAVSVQSSAMVHGLPRTLNA
jgi:hypothetical protein